MKSSFTRRLALALTVAGSVVTAANAQNFAFLIKEQRLVQTSATAISANPDRPFIFAAGIDEGTATNPAPPNSITLPNNGGTRTLTFNADRGWNLEQSFATQAALTAAYPNGTYQFTIGGRTANMPFAGDLFPPAPVITLSGGTFVNGNLVVDRTAPLTITITQSQNFVAGSSRLAVRVEAINVPSGAPRLDLEASNETGPLTGFTSNQVTLTVPANSFVPGGVYDIAAEANRIVTNDSTSIPGFTLVSAYSTTLQISTHVAGAPPPPTFTSHPVPQTVAPRNAVVFSASASNANTFQWRLNGNPIPGATNATLLLTGANVVAGRYSVFASNAQSGAQSNDALLSIANTADAGRLVNLAIRTNAGTGAETLIVGFAVGGSGTVGAKPLLIRGIGPSLGVFGLTGLLADPIATVFQDGAVVATNDNWGGDAQVLARATQVAAFGLASNTSLDAAFATSPAPGSYSVQITGRNNTTGLALAEIYDTSVGTPTATTPRLVNVSARTQVGTGGDVLIAGFTIGGATAKTVLIRATGPALAGFGVTGTLPDPQLELFSGATVIRSNNNWGGDPQLANVGGSVGAFAISDPNSRDAVLLVTLPPASYTVQVSGVNNTTGVALVELYEVP